MSDLPDPPVAKLPAGPDSIRIRLASLDLLFRAPPLDPFLGSSDGLSGIEHAVQKLRADWRTAGSRVTAIELVLPAEEVTAANTERTRAAIARYCEAQRAVVEEELHLLSKQRRRAWLVGSLYFLSCVLLSQSLARLAVLPEISRTLVSETIIIAGWVGLWAPLDMTLYAWWPGTRRRRQLAHLARLDVRLVAG